jgi:formylmethanofuran:tetrahydromethanopterin formyltransferase
MTCPTTACYNGLPVGEKSVNVGGRLRYFGDGWQISKWLAGRRYWRVPVMDGEFTCEETFGTRKGVAGGNLILMGTGPAGTLAATEAAVQVMREIALSVARRAAVVLHAGWPGTAENHHRLQELDVWLRSRGNQLNPGTTADLVTAALFAALRDGTIQLPRPAGPASWSVG